jgi:glycosyltransferase involved in cell wall biosynthesis
MTRAKSPSRARICSAVLSVIIPTLDCERELVPTLAALVSGATEGLIREVLLADGGSRDDTAVVADVAGCKFLELDRRLGARLRAAAKVARGPWLLFLRPGIILDTPWIGETRRFIELTREGERAAVFRRGAAAPSPLRQALAQALAALATQPHPAQGLLISQRFYDALGGHRADAAEPQADLIRRIGRKRIVRLATPAVLAVPVT